MAARITGKLDGKISEVAGNVLHLDAPSVVQLPYTPEQVVSYQRVGDDLILRLINGEIIRIEDFYADLQSGVRSDLVLEGQNGELWYGAHTEGLTDFSFARIGSVDQLVGATASAGGGLGLGGLLAAGLAVGAAGAIAASSSGSDNDSGSNDNGGGADTTPPARPGDLAITPDGTSLTGTGEAGSTVAVLDASGNQIAEGTVGSNGHFTVALQPPQNDGGQLSVTLTDANGNTSEPGSITAPALDTIAPEAPTDLVVASNGASITGRGEAGAIVKIYNAAGQVIGEGTVTQDGTFIAALSPAQFDGSTLSVTLTDAAGNISSAATVAAPIQDIIPPEAPTGVAIAADGSAVTGTGKPGST
ncbi:Ig-like domain-containing protein, partial [Limoniibacter endophyticus]